jgi:4-nitrophenyl phosphatase
VDVSGSRTGAGARAAGEAERVVAVPDRLYDAYVFDLDGTIYLGDDLLPGAKRLIEELHARDRAVRFVSNNPTKDPQQYADKLARLGIPAPVSEIVNTTVTMTSWLLDNHPDAVVFPISEAPLKHALAGAGIRMSEDPAEIDVVIASYDRGFTYEKLQIAFDAIWFHKRAILVGTNPDRFCPFPGGRGESECAAIIAAVEACTNTTCAANVGKPDPAMLHAALKGLDVELGDCVMVGDRLSTDIRMGLDTGMAAALVLTGETTAEDVQELPADDTPGIVVDRVDRLLPPEVWEELGWSDEEDGR